MEDSRAGHGSTTQTQLHHTDGCLLRCYNSMFWTAVNSLCHQAVVNNGKQSAHTHTSLFLSPTCRHGNQRLKGWLRPCIATVR